MKTLYYIEIAINPELEKIIDFPRITHGYVSFLLSMFINFSDVHGRNMIEARMDNSQVFSFSIRN